MKVILCFTILFSFTKVFAENQKLDLRERLQFTKNSKKEVTFEYCKLTSCEKLNTKPISQRKLSAVTQNPDLPTGLAKQLLVDAGSNSDIKMNTFGVAGLVIGDAQYTRVNCDDQAIELILNKAQKDTDFIISYDVVKNCSRSDVATLIKSEAELLKKIIKPLAQ